MTTDERLLPQPRTSEPEVVRVLLVDDHQTFAELLAMGLDCQPDIRCVGHVQQGELAMHAVDALTPQVVLVDVHLGSQDGLDLAAELRQRHPDLRVIALTASLDPVDVARAARAGACAYLPKSGALEDVLNAVRTARNGRLMLPQDMVLDLVALDRRSADRAGPRDGGPVLTAREQQVLELLGEGLDVNAIAKRLEIRTSTCRGYVQNLLGKLGAHTQLEAVVTATSRGLLRVRDDGAHTRRGRC